MERTRKGDFVASPYTLTPIVQRDINSLSDQTFEVFNQKFPIGIVVPNPWVRKESNQLKQSKAWDVLRHRLLNFEGVSIKSGSERIHTQLGGKSAGLRRNKCIVFRSDMHRLYQSGYMTLSGSFRYLRFSQSLCRLSQLWLIIGSYLPIFLHFFFLYIIFLQL